jgi:hypothetical protein
VSILLYYHFAVCQAAFYFFSEKYHEKTKEILTRDNLMLYYKNQHHWKGIAYDQK